MNVGIEEARKEEPGEGARGRRNLCYHPILVEYSPREDVSREDVDDVEVGSTSWGAIDPTGTVRK